MISSMRPIFGALRIHRQLSRDFLKFSSFHRFFSSTGESKKKYAFPPGIVIRDYLKAHPLTKYSDFEKKGIFEEIALQFSDKKITRKQVTTPEQIVQDVVCSVLVNKLVDQETVSNISKLVPNIVAALQDCSERKPIEASSEED